MIKEEQLNELNMFLYDEEGEVGKIEEEILEIEADSIVELISNIHKEVNSLVLEFDTYEIVEINKLKNYINLFEVVIYLY